jgi:hypothetical protein
MVYRTLREAGRPLFLLHLLHLLLLDPLLHLHLPQVGLHLGPYPAVVLYDYEDARELFSQVCRVLQSDL